ncbi:MAG: D-alanyl-D-alanine carboxypeptidase family protein [Opitutaceae bacterium]|nr:D-alanyl-D-alanine carboxypeptidase family protein [Opitutaceae bacterium]
MNLPPPPAGYEDRVPRFAEETRLCGVGRDAFGREVRLAVEAATSWEAMRAEAGRGGVKLLLLSGFRSVERQAEIVQKKLAAGLTLEAILRVNAYPGFSEHHTGRAVDIGSADCEHLSEAFETTREFAWLRQHAARFGFTLSYPRDNAFGIAYEPWHWCHLPKSE